MLTMNFFPVFCVCARARRNGARARSHIRGGGGRNSRGSSRENGEHAECEESEAEQHSLACAQEHLRTPTAAWQTSGDPDIPNSPPTMPEITIRPPHLSIYIHASLPNNQKINIHLTQNLLAQVPQFKCVMIELFVARIRINPTADYDNPDENSVC